MSLISPFLGLINPEMSAKDVWVCFADSVPVFLQLAPTLCSYITSSPPPRFRSAVHAHGTKDVPDTVLPSRLGSPTKGLRNFLIRQVPCKAH